MNTHINTNTLFTLSLSISLISINCNINAADSNKSPLAGFSKRDAKLITAIFNHYLDPLNQRLDNLAQSITTLNERVTGLSRNVTYLNQHLHRSITPEESAENSEAETQESDESSDSEESSTTKRRPVSFLPREAVAAPLLSSVTSPAPRTVSTLQYPSRAAQNTGFTPLNLSSSSQDSSSSSSSSSDSNHYRDYPNNRLRRNFYHLKDSRANPGKSRL